MAATITVSLLAHLALIASWPEHALPVVDEPERSVVTVRLRDDALRFIDVHTPADMPPETADLIAVHDARAASPEDIPMREEEAPAGPLAEVPDDIDLAARIPAPTSQSPVVRAAPRQSSEDVPGGKAQQEEQPWKDVQEALPDRVNIARATQPGFQERESAGTVAENGEPASEPSGAEHAAPADLRARPRGRTVTRGLTNFEALRHEIAPYLKYLRDKVEQCWMEALLMRYTGTSPARAEVFCAIAPDGTLAEARIVGMTDDPIFAGLCRDAIERAAPFKPFPFETPDIYRNQNLEINWHFSFL
ncbi:MAG TPA: hypothetical protein ENN29_06550 [Candidatus Hydrogenedentes bacterium]|nr:hypothetical protein [Candidatus Hydrogenedentota bacterium]